MVRHLTARQTAQLIGFGLMHTRLSEGVLGQRLTLAQLHMDDCVSQQLLCALLRLSGFT